MKRKKRPQPVSRLGALLLAGAGLEQSHQAELARRQVAADALARYNQTQQIINSMNRPVFTNCIGGAGMVNCVSQ